MTLASLVAARTVLNLIWFQKLPPAIELPRDGLYNLGLALLGTFPIALWRGAKNLDTQHKATADAMKLDLEQLKAPQIPSLIENARRNEVQADLANWSTEEKAMLRLAITRGTVDLPFLRGRGYSDQSITTFRDKARASQFLSEQFQDSGTYSYQVNAKLETAILAVLQDG